VSDSAVQTAPVDAATTETTTPGRSPAPTEPASPSEQLAPETEAGNLLLEGEPEPPAPPEPEPFDPEKLTVPAGIDREDAVFTEFTNFAKEERFSAPQAQKLTEFAGRMLEAATQRQQASWDKQNNEWLAEIKAHKEFGGDRLQDSVNTFKRVASDPNGPFGPDFAQAITTVGNNPAVVIPLLRVAQILSEGRPVQGGPSANGSRQAQTLGEVFYPNSSRNDGTRR